jgi:CMP-N-acetylneuraminic acid synthetase
MAGLPLIVHTLRQAKMANIFSAFAVSSDSEEILSLARSEGFIAIERPSHMATDTAAKIPVIRHCVSTVEEQTGMSFDYCVDLDCTSPLRSVEDILAVYKLLQVSDTPNVITAMPARRSPYFNMVERGEDGQIRLAKKLEKTIQRRQDAPECFDMNASIYGWKRAVLQTEDKLFLQGTSLHVMPEERSIDVDSELDFEIVRMLLEKRIAP